MDPKIHQKIQREATEATAASIASCLELLLEVDAKLDRLLGNATRSTPPAPAPAPGPAKPKGV